MLLDYQRNDVHIQGILNSLNDCAIIAHTDVQGIILGVNDLFCDISGYERVDLIGKNHRILNSGYHSHEFFKNLWATILDGKIWTGEIQNRNKRGHLYWVHTVISPVRDSNGKIVEFLTVRFDITQKKNKEKKVLDSEKRLEAAFEAFGSGSWELNLQTNKMIVSDSLLKVVCGSKLHKIDNLENLLSFVLPEDRNLVKETIENAIHRQISFNVDYRVLSSGHLEKWVNNCGDFIQSELDSPLLLRGVVVDITSKKFADKTQLVLASASKMTTLGEMACGIIHEINNPISIILGRLSIVNYELKENASPNLELFLESFKSIESAVHRMAGITKGLGSYARNSTYDPMCRIQIGQLPRQLEGICRNNFRFNNVDLRIDMTEVEDVFVMGRSPQLLQVFLNILTNALDAIKGREQAWVEVTGSRRGSNVILKFTDSGPGITSDIASRIMQPFFSTKKVGEGTGLGLSISKGIIEEHHGSLTYDSSSLNTCFIVELPFL